MSRTISARDAVSSSCGDSRCFSGERHAEIEQASKGRWIAVAFVAACFIAAAWLFANSNEVAGIAFLAAPVVTAGTQFLVNAISRSSRPLAPPDAGPGTDVAPPADPSPTP